MRLVQICCHWRHLSAVSPTVSCLFCGHFFGEFEDAFVVIWPVYKVLEVPAARCGRQLVVYLERNRDEQGQHAVVIGSNAFRIRVGDR